MKIAAYMPIKLNNTRTPGKNIKPLSDGRPLCSLMFNTMAKARNIDKKYCYCSDESIIKYLVPGIEFLKRSTALDTNETKCHEITQAFIDAVNPDIIVLAHVTSPFLSLKALETCVDKVASGRYDSAFTVSKVQEFFWKDGKPLNFNAASAPRSQDLPIYYKETNGVFVFTREAFQKTNNRVGLNPFMYETSFPETVDINYPEDFVVADAIYSSGYYVSE